MKIHALARLFEVKYELFSTGADPIEKKDPIAEYLSKNPPTASTAAVPAQIVAQVKKDLINTYNLYINSDTAKEPVLQMLADINEPFSVLLIKDFERLISNIKKGAGTINQIYGIVNKILANIKEAKASGEVRRSIHDSIKVTKESEKNYRERVKSKFEMVLLRISSLLHKQAALLKKFIPDAAPLAGEALEPQRKELSKEKLSIFMKGPAAKIYGLDNINVMEKILFFPELRAKVTTLINAIERGHLPIDGPEVMKETAEIIVAFKARETNVDFFENPEQDLGNKQLEIAERGRKDEARQQQELALKYDPAYVAKQHEKTIQDEELAERNIEFDKPAVIEEDRDRLIPKNTASYYNNSLINKYNSLSFSDWLKRSCR